jgi:hypothetical protein
MALKKRGLSRERAAIAILADAVDDNIKTIRQDAREVFALVVDSAWRRVRG